jgi:hypothetical protein
MYEASGQLHARGKSYRYPLYKRMGGAQNQSGNWGIEKNLLPLPGIELRFLGRPVSSLVCIPTELFQLLCI